MTSAEWLGDFSTGDLSQYPTHEFAASDRVTIRTDSPRHSRLPYARFRAEEEDIAPLTPTINPRAQIAKPQVFSPGDTSWIRWSTRFAADFPSVIGGTDANPFMVFAQIHGSPYTGSPQIGMGVGVGSTTINMRRNVTYAFDQPWSTPMVKGVWHDFALHVHFANDLTGWVELYFNGEQQALNGVSRLYMKTIEDDQLAATGGLLDWIPTFYRARGMWQSSTVDHSGHRITATAPTVLRPGAVLRRGRVRALGGKVNIA